MPGIKKNSVDSALGVLRPFARLVKTHFFPLDCARIAGQESGLTQHRAQTLVVFHQRTRQTMTNRARLTEAAAAAHGSADIEFADRLSDLQRLPYDHARHFATKIIVDSAVIDGDITGTRGNEDTRCGGLAAAGSVIG